VTTRSRKECLAGRPCEPATIVEAIDCVAHHSSVTLEQIAERIGRSVNYLRKATSAYDDAHPFRADLIVPVSLASANAAIVRYLARAVGGAYVPLPSAALASAGEFLSAAHAVQDFGRTLETFAQITADNDITNEEADRFARQAQETIEAILQLAAAVRARVPRKLDI
jgi:hypothetical protein